MKKILGLFLFFQILVFAGRAQTSEKEKAVNLQGFGVQFGTHKMDGLYSPGWGMSFHEHLRRFHFSLTFMNYSRKTELSYGMDSLDPRIHFYSVDFATHYALYNSKRFSVNPYLAAGYAAELLFNENTLYLGLKNRPLKVAGERYFSLTPGVWFSYQFINYYDVNWASLSFYAGYQSLFGKQSDDFSPRSGNQGLVAGICFELLLDF